MRVFDYGRVGGVQANPTQIVEVGCGIGACIFSARAGTVCADTASLHVRAFFIYELDLEFNVMFCYFKRCET